MDVMKMCVIAPPSLAKCKRRLLNFSQVDERLRSHPRERQHARVLRAIQGSRRKYVPAFCPLFILHLPAIFLLTYKPPAPFAGGNWKIHVEIPDQYPYKSPSIGFVNRIFHPNIDELSGSVCLDVINQTWSPMYDMINIFEVFLPQLLRYPNPTDPLNGEAAALMMREPKSYEAKVKGVLHTNSRLYRWKYKG